MGKMSELSQVLDELVACDEGLIKAADVIRDIFTTKPDEQPQDKPPKTEPSAEPQAEEPKKYTFTEVRKAFSAKSHAGYTEQVKTLIGKYGAAKLSAVKEEDYPSLMADLEEIG